MGTKWGKQAKTDKNGQKLTKTDKYMLKQAKMDKTGQNWTKIDNSS